MSRMTDEQIQKARETVRKLKGYQRGSRPALQESFPRFVEDELGLKIAPLLQNLILVIQALDQRLTDLEGDA